MEPERARRLRRKIWAAAFFLAIGLLIWQTFSGTEQLHITLVLELGPKADTITRLEGELLADDEVVATLAHNPPIGTPRFSVTVPAKDLVLQVRLHVPNRVIQVRRAVTAEDNATIFLPLARELD